MKPKLKKRLLVSSIVCALLLVAGFCSRDFWTEQFQIYLMGLITYRSYEFGINLPDVDEIEVIALGAPKGAGSGDDVEDYTIASQTVLRGDDAQKVARIWRFLQRGECFVSLCHNPIYALRFRQQGKLIFETTICWHCHTYTIPMGVFGTTEYGFDSDSGDAQLLLQILESHVPLPGKPK
jgi:hypothetical protein